MALTQDFLNDEAGLLEILFDRMPVGIAIFDRDLVLRRCNPTWAEYIGRYTPTPASQVVPGARFDDLAPGTETTSLRRFRRALAGETVREEAVPMQSDGIVSYWDVVITPLVQHGQVVGIVDVTTAATERVLAYQTLEQRVADRTRELSRELEVSRSLRDILAVLNSSQPLDEILDHIVAQACRLLSTDAGAVYRLEPDGNHFTIQSSRGLPADHAHSLTVAAREGAIGRAVLEREPLVVSDLTAAVRSDDPSLDARLRRHLAGLAIHYRALLAVPLVVKDEVYGAIVLYYGQPRQFSAEEVELAVTFGDQAALAIQNARLRDQAEQSAVTAERNRLARDLHDAVTQTLFSASLIAEVLPRLWERSPAEGRRRLEELRQLTRGALAEMRTLLLELRPAALTEVGLGELLRQLADAVTGRARVPVKLTVEGQRSLPPDVQIALYRIAQGALNNVAKHSGASQATVSLRCQPGQVTLRVSDDGRGFDPSRVTPEHLGLGIMRERAQAIGATLTIRSRVGHGTEIAVVWSDTRMEQRNDAEED